MKRNWQVCFTFFMLMGLSIFYSCGVKDIKTKPEEYLSESQKTAMLTQLVLKTAGKPEGFLKREEMEAYYKSEARSYFWHFLHEKDGRYYFFVSRPAPSLYGKRAGIGGFFTSDDRMSIRNYREVFQTFKLKPEEMERKGGILFEAMVNNRDLKVYQPGGKKALNEEWIEFPDALNYFDTLSSAWKTRLLP